MKKWKPIETVSGNDVKNLEKSCNLPRVIAMYLASKGVKADEVEGFLNPKLSNLSDPYRFPDIKLACERLWKAISNKEPILIHGDYDTDGITAGALLAFVLRQNGAIVNSFIPHRFDDGYGFTPESLEKAIEAFGDCKVLVTVDCGVTSCEAVAVAKEMGIDVIITDHHEAADKLPDALAIINPKVNPELADLQILAGAGVAFKLSHAFIKYGRANNLGGFSTRLEEILDYVALGTVADIVPLLGENRIMVKYGIEALKRQIRPGIRALIENSKIKNELTPSDITFRMAPRINAAGRVGDANIALKLLESKQIVEAYQYAGDLEKFNRTRQEKESEIYQEAKDQIERKLAWMSDYSLLVAGRDWHQGVIGIVASRLARDYNRPTIVLTIQGENAYGSGRSIASLNLVDALSSTSSLLERYGGHPMAVGIGLKAENIAPFFDAMDLHIRKQITQADLDDFVSYDGEAFLYEIDNNFFEHLAKLAPFGHSNPKPLLRFNDVQIIRCSAIGSSHCCGVLKNASGQMNFIAFNKSELLYNKKKIDILANAQMNVYNSVSQPQLSIVDYRESAWQ